MKIGKRHRRLIAGILVSALIFVAVLTLLPSFINIGPFKNAIQSTISERLGATISYDNADLYFFPRPGLIFRNGKVFFPDGTKGSFDSIAAYFEILPLLRGGLGVSSLRIIGPKVGIQLKARDPNKKIPTLEELRRELQGLTKTLGEKVPNLEVVVKKGSLTLFEDDQSAFSFSDLDVDLLCPPAGAKIRVSGSPSFAKSMKVFLELDGRSLSGKGEVHLGQLRAEPLSRYFMPAGDVRVEGTTDLNFRFATAGMKTIEGEGSSSLASLTLMRRGKRLAIRGDTLNLGFLMSDDRTEVSLRELRLAEPRLALEGSLAVEKRGPISMKIDGRGIDLRSARKAAYSLAGNVPVVQNIFSYLKAGTVPSVTVSSQAASYEELGNTENIRIRGGIENGNVFISGPDLDVKGVYGDCVIINGMLDGTGIEGRVDRIRIRRGKVRVGLKGSVVPLRLDAGVIADMGSVLRVLRRLLKDEAAVHELSLFSKVEGNAAGRLILEGKSDAPRVTADMRAITLSADYARVPYPVRISGGGVLYDGARIASRNLRGSVGDSSFSGLSASVGLKKSSTLNISSGSISLSLPEVSRWLGAYEAMKPFQARLGSLDGTVSLSSLEVTGPLRKPEEWRFRAEGRGKGVGFTASDLPGRVAIPEMGFEATEEKVSFSGAHVGMLDSALDLSGELSAYRTDDLKLDVTLAGSVGPESFEWVSRRLKFPPWIRTSMGLELSKLHLIHQGRGTTALSGDMTVTKGPEISLDLLSGRKGLNINRLFIRDSSSKAEVSLTLEERKLGVAFSGRLTGETAGRVLDLRGYSGGWVSGDIRGEVSLSEPGQFAATGKMSAAGFVIPWKGTEPLVVDRLSVDADGEQFRLDSCDLRWGEEKISLRGSLTSSPKGLRVDMDASAAVIDAENIAKKLKAMEKEGGQAERGSGPAVPSAEGTVRLRVGRLQYGKMSLSPLSAVISLRGHGAVVDLTEADFCGISIPGRLDLGRGDLAFDLGPGAKNGSLESAISCLSHSFDLPDYATGKFDLSGHIIGRGGGKEDFIRSIAGDIDFTARDGRIYNVPSVLKLLDFLDARGIVRGFGEMRKKGLDYNKILMKTRLTRSRLAVEEGILDAPSMKIAAQGYLDLEEKKLDVRVLVSPMRTVDRIIERVPVVGWIFGGTILSIPVRITGDLQDPKVSVLSLSSVDAALTGIMKRTLTLPFKVITPSLQDGKEGAEGDSDRAR